MLLLVLLLLCRRCGLLQKVHWGWGQLRMVLRCGLKRLLRGLLLLAWCVVAVDDIRRLRQRLQA